MQKKKVWILFGGKSTEHEVSVRSARNVLWAIDTQKYEPALIWINKLGRRKALEVSYLHNQENKVVELFDDQDVDAMTLDYSLPVISDISDVDVIFPVLHGGTGEDGSVQWLLRTVWIPFVWPNVLGSAICMDKDVAKRLLDQAGIRVAPWVTLKTWTDYDLDEIIQNFWFPLFVKPANAGSSVWVSKASDLQKLQDAITDAFRYDTKILVEQAIIWREIECAVLGNETPKASTCGEIIPVWHEFYSYESKYQDESGSDLLIPADVSDEQMQLLQQEALTIYTTLECVWLSRVDMFLTPDGEIYCNEVNTLPWFTNISMYPKLWEASGLSYTDLISELIELALHRYDTQNNLTTVI